MRPDGGAYVLLAFIGGMGFGTLYFDSFVILSYWSSVCLMVGCLMVGLLVRFCCHFHLMSKTSHWNSGRVPFFQVTHQEIERPLNMSNKG